MKTKTKTYRSVISGNQLTAAKYIAQILEVRRVRHYIKDKAAARQEIKSGRFARAFDETLLRVDALISNYGETAVVETVTEKRFWDAYSVDYPGLRLAIKIRSDRIANGKEKRAKRLARKKRSMVAATELK